MNYNPLAHAKKDLWYLQVWHQLGICGWNRRKISDLDGRRVKDINQCWETDDETFYRSDSNSKSPNFDTKTLLIFWELKPSFQKLMNFWLVREYGNKTCFKPRAIFGGRGWIAGRCWVVAFASRGKPPLRRKNHKMYQCSFTCAGVSSDSIHFMSYLFKDLSLQEIKVEVQM